MIDAVIVLYNKNIEKSNSYNSLKCQKFLDILVLDNSNPEYVRNNGIYCSKNGIKYFSMNGNVGLSKAYNFALNNTSNKYILFCDDDTSFEDDFSEVVKENIEKFDSDILYPIVRDKKNDTICFPFLYNTKKVRKTVGRVKCEVFSMEKKEEFEKSKHMKSINSGAIFKKFDGFLFDENLFLGFIDYNVADKMHELGKSFKILDTTIHQEFSYGNEKYKSAIARYNVSQGDTAYYLGIIQHMKLMVYYTLKYKKTKFISSTIKYYIGKNK